MKYTLYIKDNNGDAPSQDYEDECEAKTLNEASQKFYQRLPFEGREEWSPRVLKRHIYKEEEPEWTPEQQTETNLPIII